MKRSAGCTPFFYASMSDFLAGGDVMSQELQALSPDFFLKPGIKRLKRKIIAPANSTNAMISCTPMKHKDMIF
jgi:hypothetical protein